MTALRLEEAVPLGYAMISRVARDAGVRALAIKGPVASHLGLRSPHRSVDVDVWVHPNDISVFADAVGRYGWSRRLHPTAARILPAHSHVYLHAAWPCEFDVHEWFPGMTESNAQAFEALWVRRQTMSIAGEQVPTTDFIGATLIAALHLLRDPHERIDEYAELRKAWESTATNAEHAIQLRTLAIQTGATASMQPFWQDIGLEAASGGAEERNFLWDVRTQSGDLHTLPVLLELRRTSPVRWFRIAWRAVTLPAEEVLDRYPWFRGRRLGVTRARFVRFGFAFRDMRNARRLLRSLDERGG